MMTRWICTLAAWLSGFFHGNRSRRGLEEEFRFHMDMETEANIRAGMAPAEARRRARLSFGARDWHAERAREEGGGALLEDLARDLRSGLRNLRKRPAFAVAATLTLSLGIGMTTTMFTLVDGVLLRPLPGSNAEGMVYLGLESEDGRVEISPTPQLLRLVRENVSSFSRVEAYAMEDFDLTVEGEPFMGRGGRASVGFFSFLGVQPALGRAFLPEDGQGGENPVVVLSRTLWMERFGGDREILGRRIGINDITYVVVGVLPGDFRVDTPAEALFWIPEGAAGELLTEGVPVEGALAKLAEGVSLDAARAELTALIRNNPMEELANLTWEGRIREPAQLVDPSLKQAILIFQAAALLVLLIGCGNLTNLLLAQGEARGRELALRASLGAGRGRIVRQLLVESLVLGAGGAVGGILLTQWALGALPLFLPPEYGSFSLNGRLFFLAAGVSLFSVLVAALLPALRGSRRDLGEVIKGSGGVAGRPPIGMGGRRLLVTAEVAMAVVLLVSGGLLLKSFAGLMTWDVGFDHRNLLALRLELSERRYGDPEERAAFYRQLREEIRLGLPGQVGSATVANGLVENLAAAMGPVAPEGGEEREEDPTILIAWKVAPDYFDVVGIPVMAGRAFLESDGREGEEVVIINQELAERYFPGRDPVGQRIRLRSDAYRVVGVAGSVELPDLARSILGDLQLFFPFPQKISSGFTILARVEGDRSAAIDLLKQSVWRIDPSVPILDVSLVEDDLAESLAQERANALLMGLFAFTALMLGAVGIYGVVAYSVSRRVREMGIRMALGASEGEVVGRVVWGGMMSVVLGMIVGGAGALAVGKALSGLLVRVSPRDPEVFLVVFLLTGFVALLSTWLPARRAAGVRPVEALRTD